MAGRRGRGAADGTLREDLQALAEILRAHPRCEATGEPLDVEHAVVLTVRDGGTVRVAVVSAEHWDAGRGRLSWADPDVVDLDVLHGPELLRRQREAHGQATARTCPWPPAQARAIRRGSPRCGL
jgi:hypothetical protein